MKMKKTIRNNILEVLAIAGASVLIVWAVGCTKNGNRNVGVSSTVSSTDPNSSPKSGFRAELKTEPSEVEAGKPTELIISIKDANGAVVRNLDLSHEKPLHLIVVSSDLSEFYHVHPNRNQKARTAECKRFRTVATIGFTPTSRSQTDRRWSKSLI
jgi:hypothetical protein